MKYIPITREIINDLLCYDILLINGYCHLLLFKSRFIINTPECERSLERIGFKLQRQQNNIIQQDAYWHYLDFYTEKQNYQKLSFPDFIEIIKNATPFLKGLPTSSKLIDQNFQEYKKKIPRYGCIIINQDRNKILLGNKQSFQHILISQSFDIILKKNKVKNATSKKYGFPKGQINYNENPMDCAIRETIEEIGFNVTNYILQDVNKSFHIIKH